MSSTSCVPCLKPRRNVRKELENCWRRAGELLAQLRRWQDGAAVDYIRWGESYTLSLQLNATPLVIASIMQSR